MLIAIEIWCQITFFAVLISPKTKAAKSIISIFVTVFPLFFWLNYFSLISSLLWQSVMTTYNVSEETLFPTQQIQREGKKFLKSWTDFFSLYFGNNSEKIILRAFTTSEERKKRYQDSIQQMLYAIHFCCGRIIFIYCFKCHFEINLSNGLAV